MIEFLNISQADKNSLWAYDTAEVVKEDKSIVLLVGNRFERVPLEQAKTLYEALGKALCYSTLAYVNPEPQKTFDGGVEWVAVGPTTPVSKYVTDSRCNYFMSEGSICNKCGNLHDGKGQVYEWIDLGPPISSMGKQRTSLSELRQRLGGLDDDLIPSGKVNTPKCRDCADFGPICPNSGKPCV